MKNFILSLTALALLALPVVAQAQATGGPVVTYGLQSQFLTPAGLCVLGADGLTPVVLSNAVTQTALSLYSGTTPVTTGTVAAGGTSSYTSQAFAPNPVTGFAVWPNVQSLIGGTGTVTFNFAPSLNGTNAATANLVSVSVALTGIVPALGYVNAPPLASGSGVVNAPYYILQSVTNTGTAGLQINSITVSASNR